MKYLFSILLFLVTMYGWSRNLSPFDWGFDKAKTSMERYSILHAVHAEAVKRGVDVDYSGMPKKIEIEIPENATPILLTENNNFRGITFFVQNKRKDLFLFERKGTLIPIELLKKDIDNASFKNIPKINKGRCLIVIEDANYWTERIGYSYSVKRKDILLVEEGIGINKVIQTYNNEYSLPKCFFRYVDEEKTIIKNVTIKRSENSTRKTYVLLLTNLNDVRIDGVDIETPKGNMYGDKALNICNCTNVSVKNVNIKGSYSQKDKYGYGIHMDNVYNVSFKNLNTTALWGIFGTNNLSEVILDKCDINRFDIHCYGKNVFCKNTTFNQLYNQFSSFYGVLIFDKCRFNSFIPVLLEPSFNAYTDFQLKLIDCKWNVDESCNYLLYVGNFGNAPNKRKELTRKFIPSIFIKNLIVYLSPKVKNVYLIKAGTISSSNKITLSKIEIDGLKFKYPTKHDEVHWFISTKEILFEEGFVYTTKRLKFVP